MKTEIVDSISNNTFFFEFNSEHDLINWFKNWQSVVKKRDFRVILTHEGEGKYRVLDAKRLNPEAELIAIC